jgi:hypothetical protein
VLCSWEQKARADDFVVFDDGYLRAHVASLMMRLYAHVKKIN